MTTIPNNLPTDYVEGAPDHPGIHNRTNERINLAVDQVNENTADIEALQTELDIEEAAEGTVAATVAGHTSALASHTSTLASHTTAIADLETELGSLPEGVGNFTAKPFENINQFSYGHSYGANNLTTIWNIVGSWPNRVAARLGTYLVNRHYQGAVMADMAFMAIGGTVSPWGTNTWVAGSKGLVTVEAMWNDIDNPNAANSAFQLGYKNALRAFIACVQAASRVESAAASSSGTWSTNALALASGGSNRIGSTQNGYLEWTGISSAAGYVWLLTNVWDASVAVGTMDVTVDGVTQVSGFTGIGGMKSHASLSGTYTFGAHVIKVPVPNTGSHTIRVTKTDASANGVYVDALFIPSVTPPPVMIMKDPPVPSDSMYYANYGLYKATYSALIDAIVTEFAGTGVMALDLATGYDASTMVSRTDSAHLHPNEFGQKVIGDNVTQAWVDNYTPFAAGQIIP